MLGRLDGLSSNDVLRVLHVFGFCFMDLDGGQRELVVALLDRESKKEPSKLAFGYGVPRA